MQAPWDQTWHVITTPSPWQFTTWFDLLDHWQTLVAGVLAVLAAVGGTVVAVSAARREVKAMRLSLAVEIRRLVNVLLQARETFRRASSENKPLLADDVVKEISRGAPIVFPAMADRIGLLGFRLAPYVLMFYANLTQLEHAGRMAATMVEPPVCRPDDLRALMKLIEDACRHKYCRCCPNFHGTKPTPTPNSKRRLKQWVSRAGRQWRPWVAFRRFRPGG